MIDPKDARGTAISAFKKNPARIISLVPSQTELLHHLGLAEEVVGITKFCIHPDAWFRSKTRIGGTKNVNLEKIKQLNPDLILANKEENVKEQIEELAAAFPVWVTDVNNLEDALNMIETVGILTGKSEPATFLNSHITIAFEQLNIIKPAKHVRVCYLIWQDPFITVGSDTFIHAMLQHAGFDNVFAHEKRYPQITMQQLQEQACDLLFLSSEPYPFSEKHVAAFQSILPGTRIKLVDGEMFSWYGSRLQWAPAYFQTLQSALMQA